MKDWLVGIAFYAVAGLGIWYFAADPKVVEERQQRAIREAAQQPDPCDNWREVVRLQSGEYVRLYYSRQHCEDELEYWDAITSR